MFTNGCQVDKAIDPQIMSREEETIKKDIELIIYQGFRTIIKDD
jgi:hypothetical protein